MPSRLEDILSRADIVEIISSYYPLQKAGKNYRTHCPYHPEKKPSFTVSPDKQIFHCFGCGVGGNVINFIMLEERVEWWEAVKILAEKLGIPWEEKKDKDVSSLYEITEKASLLFQKYLLGPQGKHAYEYLEKRGVNLGIQEELKLGYAPPTNWLTYWNKEKFPLLVKAGLALEREGEIFPYFRNRIIFPIFNLSGRIVAFGGRTLEDAEPKYLNSPETPIFEKGRTLYGLHLTRREIQEKGEVILVEGYMDFLTLYQYGIKNVCASLGTSFTTSQANLLRRFASRVTLLYDSDEAGIKATLRAIEQFWKEGVEVRVAILPPEEDPDSFLKKEGKEKLEELLEKGMDGLEFYLLKTKEFEGGNITSTVEKIFQCWREMKDMIKREELILRSAKILGISPRVIKDQWAGFSRRRKVVLPSNSPPPFTPEKYLLSLFLRFPEFRDKFLSRFSLEDIEEEGVRRVLEVLREADKETNLPSLLERLGEEDKQLVSGIILAEIPHSNPEREIRDCLRKIKEKKINKLRQKIQRLEEERRWDELMGCMRELECMMKDMI